MYRISRNIESSLIDYLEAELTSDGWTGIRTVKAFTEVYEGTLPCICINVLEIRPQKLEIGSKAHIKYFTVNIRVFAKSDGARLDLSDWVFEKIEDDVDYYEYAITDGTVSDKELSGKIIITRYFENKKELTNTENLELADKFRHLISFEAYVVED
jgi:hypothetical protein